MGAMPSRSCQGGEESRTHTLTLLHDKNSQSLSAANGNRAEVIFFLEVSWAKRCCLTWVWWGRKNLASAEWRKSFQVREEQGQDTWKFKFVFLMTTEGSAVARLVEAGGLAIRAERAGPGAPLQILQLALFSLLHFRLWLYYRFFETSGKSFCLVFSFLPCKKRGLNDLIC